MFSSHTSKTNSDAFHIEAVCECRYTSSGICCRAQTRADVHPAFGLEEKSYKKGREEAEF